MKKDLKTALKGILSSKEIALVCKSFDIIGDIVVIRVPEQLLPHSKKIAEVLMTQHKHVKAVWRQSGPVHGEFRLRKLEWVAGERKTKTIYKEYGCVFKVDIKDCYFSPRLGFERMRIAKQVKEDEVVVNMFAGVGSYSITIAKHSRASKIYSIDINPIAVRYLRENILLNKAVNRVFPIEGEAKAIVEGMLSETADRVIMPLPEKAHSFLNSAILTAKPQGSWIHYYDFEYARKKENPVEKVKAKITKKLHKQSINFTIPFGRIVRQTGPNWYQIAIDVQL
ncbi:MAG: class I SAM-dependent methyltransferase family protein [Candidatus Bathyarchaeota archaeon]|nr:MAG: class I SAM-dependent methyltransferase family protein [Candidatus Bathyarchaeota archaeon]